MTSMGARRRSPLPRPPIPRRMLEWPHEDSTRQWLRRHHRQPALLMPGPELKTEAIVMGSHKLGEADRVITLFSEKYGRVPTVVKGVRKVGSRFGGRLEPFTHLRVSLHRGRNLFTLTGADTVRTRAVLRDNSASLRAGLSVIDLAVRTSPEQERRPRAYNLLERFLKEMETVVRSGGNNVRPLALAAELKLLLLTGFLPHLADCATCGGSGNLSRFNAAAGGTVCDNCAGGFPVSGAAVGGMRQLLTRPLAEAGLVEISEAAGQEIWLCLKEICLYHQDVKLRVAPW